MRTIKEMDFEVDKITYALTKLTLYFLLLCVVLLVVSNIVKMVV